MTIPSHWLCPHCQERVPANFNACWNCGASPSGASNPAFRHADDYAPQRHPLPKQVDVWAVMRWMTAACVFLAAGNVVLGASGAAAFLLLLGAGSLLLLDGVAWFYCWLVSEDSPLREDRHQD